MKTKRQSESDLDDDSTIADNVEIVIRIKPKHVRNFLSSDLLGIHKNRWEKDTKTKKRPAKDNSTPVKKPRHSENKENNNGEWKCAICALSCKSWENLNVHVNTAHEEEEEEEEKNEKARKSTRWQCEVCKKSYSNKGNLVRHVRSAHLAKKNIALQCGRCGKKYTTKENLKRHVKTHSVNSRETVAAVTEKKVLTKDKEVAAVTEKTVQIKDKHEEKAHSGAPLKEVAALRKNTGGIEDTSNSTETPKLLVTKVTNYECKCGKTEDTYDASVRHAQEHLVELQALIRENGAECKLKFDRHNRGDNNNRSFIQTKFDYKTLLKNSWFNMFKPTDLSSTILTSSLYKYTRCVKLNWDSDKKEEGHCVPLYKCGACGLFVEPAKVENHCHNYRACVACGSKKHECLECQKPFNTAKALMLHKADHDTYKNLRFRIVTFNNEDDVQFNMALEQMSLLSVGNTPAKEQEKISGNPTTPERNALEKNDVNNVAIRVSKYCELCKSSYSDLEGHRAYHEMKSKRIMETIRREQQSLAAAAEAAATQNGNTEKEADKKVSHNHIIRKGNEQAHQHNANDDERMAIDSESVVMVWNSDSDSDDDEDDDDQQSFHTFSSKAKHFVSVVTKEDEIKQKTDGKLRNNDDDSVKGEHDQFNQCELTLGRIFGPDNGVDTIDIDCSDNESTSTEDLKRLLEGDAESVLSDDEWEENGDD